ncbi:unnamed protein product [Clonostachys rhizophaga]|uniref:RNA polymerase II subunit A C-terminal domain phosphatase n=1 Tax=Clonostachys rhizophaga TaxID=160324 RepID=A0A9N9VM93_9HYPO|nr:unnamed protein product [Clonostachys rhizophaga]
MYDKVVSLGTRLHYPITITKLLKKPGDNIKKQETIIEYKFTWRRRVGEDNWTDETTYTEYDSPAEGTLKEWRIKEGMVINADTPCMTVQEACGHEVQIQGLCSLCGADMTEINWASEERDTERAMINMTHDQTGLMVSESVAMKAENDTQKRLLRQRKLSLVVDLDQTIIHACIEPTVGEWMRDPSNPNHNAVKDVKSFQLSDDGPRSYVTGCTYYIKLRPGLEEFLQEISTMYELHVYTMGTRAYAQNIARIVDPDKKLFGNRVISRDENGSITAKSLQRLFPVSTNMVVIIDDRADVWPMNRPNLIKVVPYDFFKGIGDINSSFLPKRTDIVPSPTNGTLETTTNEDAKLETDDKAAVKASPLDELARMSGADDESSLQSKTEEQERVLEKQLTDRPLLHMQEELDKEEGQPGQENEPGDHHHRQNLLTDDDEELIALQDHLTDLHSAFYETYDKRREERRESDPKHRPGDSKTKQRRRSIDDGVDLSMVPDVGDILDELKSNVLSGLVIVLSGLVPLGVNIEESEIGMQAQSHGAQVVEKVTKRVTHLVVSTARPRTQKVRAAAKIPSIHIVNQNWLIDSLSQWRRLDEQPYYINVSAADRAVSEEQMDTSEAEDNDTAKDLKDMDWDAADKEMLDFLGLEDDDELDDEETDASEDADGELSGSEADKDGDSDSGESERKTTTLSVGLKRKAPPDDGDSGSEADAPAGESILAKKQRVARNRGASGLRSVHTSNEDLDDEESQSLPTPVPTTADDELSPSQLQAQEQEEMDSLEADLEREMMAELEGNE